MKKNFFIAVKIFLFFTFFCGAFYNLVITAMATTIFTEQSSGSLIKKDNKILGSKLIGQNFSEPKYLWGRPSATLPYPYNAAASSGSNLDWSNQNFYQNIQKRIDLLQKYTLHNGQKIPIDLLTASASGLDPEISVDAALYQVGRIAKFRGVTEEKIIAIIKKHTLNKQFNWLGENRVNVLQVNLELDNIAPHQHRTEIINQNNNNANSG